MSPPGRIVDLCLGVKSHVKTQLNVFKKNNSDTNDYVNLEIM